ncbi:MAG: hypothetical protein WCV90_00905 [Candidatus Woesearchaeota archaeon]
MTLRQKIFIGLFCAAALVNPFTIKCARAPNLQTKLSQAEAEKVLEEEKNNLGITTPIEYQWGKLPEKYGGAIGKHPDKDEMIIVADPDKVNRSLIRHELYHLFKKDKGINSCAIAGRTFEESLQNMDRAVRDASYFSIAAYLLYPEPAADLYSITGIRL